MAGLYETESYRGILDYGIGWIRGRAGFGPTTPAWGRLCRASLPDARAGVCLDEPSALWVGLASSPLWVA